MAAGTRTSSDAARRAVHLVDGAVERWNRAVLRLVLPPADRAWSSPGGRRVLAVAPHPDDETAGCGGTLARHALAGDDVTVVFVTDGRRSRALGLAPEEMARRRRAEAFAAAEAIGARAEWIGLFEGEWEEGAAIGCLASALERFLPDVVYAPSRIDFHPEHVRVAHALGAALARDARAAIVRIYGVQVPLGPLANLVCDVAPARLRLEAAIAAHVTQRGTLRPALRTRRYAAAIHGRPDLAEELCETSAAAYAAAHSAPADPEPFRTFRGLRRHPFTDLLAWRVGRRARRDLARDLAASA